MNPLHSNSSNTPAEAAADATGDSAVRRPPRVLLVAPGLDPSSGGIAGVGHSISRLFENKSAQGALVYRGLDLYGDPSQAPSPDPTVASSVRAFGSARWQFSAAVLRAMSTWADLVVFTHVGPASLMVMLPRRLRPRSVVFLHGIEVWTRLNFRKRLAVEQADMLISNTQFTADRARQFNPGIGDVRCCHLGIADDVDGEAPCQPLSAAGPHDILIVGRMSRFERYKGHAELIAAMPEVLRQVPTARLIVTGTGDDQPRYAAQAAAAGIADRVIFTGFLPANELWQTYRRSTLLAMPSRGEGFGLVYLEAMRAGLPCVASTVDAAGGIVLNDSTGLLVDPDNNGQLANALTRLLLDRALCERLGAAGRRRFEGHFTERHFHARFWSLIESVLPLPRNEQEIHSG
jgi:phosphatidylinositol alpha-1,6-mannosyltransferase